MQNQNLTGVSSAAVTPQINHVDVFQQVEQALENDVRQLQYLAQAGIINQSQSQYLMTQLAAKAQQLNMLKNSYVSTPVQTQIPDPVQAQEPSKINPFEAFSKEHPGFFDSDSRASVFEYIKDLDVDKDEISKIAKLVEELENSAIDGYMKKSAHEKSLNDENETAKSKLTAYAQNAGTGSNYGRIFTREDIGKMSGDEFAKNEKLIFEQVKQGLIK